MKVILLARGLRNFAGHNIETQDVFVDEYPKIINWLISAIIVALSSIPNPPTTRISATRPATRPSIQNALTTIKTTTNQITANQIISDETVRTSPPTGGTRSPFDA